MRKRRLYRDRVKNYFIVPNIVYGVLLLSISSADAYKVEIPPYYGLQVNFVGNISESYSTNITFATDKENRIEDFVTRLSGGLDIGFEGKRRKMDFSGRVNRQYRNETFDSLNPSEHVNMSYIDELSQQDSISLYNTFHHTRVPSIVEDVALSAECEKIRRERGIDAVRLDHNCNTFAGEFGRFQGSFESYNNDFNANYDSNFSKYLTFKMGYGNSLRWSSREDVNDSILHRTGFGINYQYSPMTSFNMSYNYATRNFENSGDVSTHTPNIGITQYLTKRLIFSGRIGINISTLSDGETSSGRNVNALLTHEITEKTHSSISFQRTDSINSDKEDVFRNWRIIGTFTSQLTEDINSVLEGFYGEGDFILTDVTDKFFGASFSLNYRIWEHKSGANIRGNMGYIYSELNSTDESRGYTRGTINGGLTAGF